MEKKRKWMKAAVPEDRKGVFKEKAEKAGMSTQAYAKQEAHARGKLGKEARLATTFAKMRPNMSKLREKMHGKEA